MTITTKDIIRLLPFGKAFQQHLLESFDTLLPDQRFEIEQLLWSAYASYYQTIYNKNMNAALEHAVDGEQALDAELGKKIKEQTEKEVLEGVSEKAAEVDLNAARNALQSIIGKSDQST